MRILHISFPPHFKSNKSDFAAAPDSAAFFLIFFVRDAAPIFIARLL